MNEIKDALNYHGFQQIDPDLQLIQRQQQMSKLHPTWNSPTTDQTENPNHAHQFTKLTTNNNQQFENLPLFTTWTPSISLKTPSPKTRTRLGFFPSLPRIRRRPSLSRIVGSRTSLSLGFSGQLAVVGAVVVSTHKHKHKRWSLQSLSLSSFSLKPPGNGGYCLLVCHYWLIRKSRTYF